MVKITQHSLWNIKDIIILQFIFFLTRELSLWAHEVLVEGEHFIGFLFPVGGYLIFFGIVFFWLFFLYEVPPPYLGLTLEKLKTGAVLGLKLGIPMVLLAIFLINYPLTAGESPPDFSPVFSIGGAEDLPVSFLYLIGYSALFFLPALGTELYFRAIIGGYFHRKWGTFSGAFLSSVFFAIFWGPLHSGWPIFHFVLALGLYYCYISRESLWPGVVYLTLVKAGLTVYAVGWEYFSM